jgi:hypothetical protein
MFLDRVFEHVDLWFHLDQALVNISNPRLDLGEFDVVLIEPVIDLVEPVIDLVEPVIDLVEPVIDLVFKSIDVDGNGFSSVSHLIAGILQRVSKIVLERVHGREYQLRVAPGFLGTPVERFDGFHDDLVDATLTFLGRFLLVAPGDLFPDVDRSRRVHVNENTRTRVFKHHAGNGQLGKRLKIRKFAS